ncbi:MAG: hypothetical protein AAF449_01775, partial [Myxococcota bacterium]
ELTERLAETLSELRATSVRGGRLVRRLLPEGSIPADCAISEPCQERVRQTLEAERLIFVVATRIGDTIQLDPTVITRSTAESRPALRGRLEDTQKPQWWIEQASHLLPPTSKTVVEPPAPLTPPSAEASAAVQNTPKWPLWALTGLTAASLGVGIGFGIAAQSEADGLQDRGCPSAAACTDADVDSAAQKAMIADIMYATSGVAAIATVLMLIYNLDDPAPVAVGVGPSGVSVAARF